jgi:hypothetical protein
MGTNTETPMVKLTRQDIEKLFLPLPRQVVIPAPEGRFLLHVPKFDDGLGPIRTPNVKHLVIDMEGGREGTVDLKRCESEPQAVKTDGTQVIVINKIDKYAALALQAKLEDLEEEHGGRTRTAIEKFMNYVRGFEFNPETGKAKLAVERIGFNPDIYFQSLGIAQKLHYSPKDRFRDLMETPEAIPAGRYVKKPVPTTAVYIDTPVAYENQTFNNGVMLQISTAGENGRRSISFIDPSDIEQCYTWLDGKSLVDESGNVQLPHYKISPELEVQTDSKTHAYSKGDVQDLESIKVKTQSSRIYIKPDARFFEGKEEVSFWNEADQVNQKLKADDGVIIAAFNYRVKNDDYQLKADKFQRGVEKAHSEAKNFEDLIKKVSALYRDLDIGTPDIYTSTREKMKLTGLEGVSNKVAVKEGQAELVRISAPGDVLRFYSNSEHRGAAQTYAGEMFVQITDRGNEKYEKFRGVQSQFAAMAYETEAGKPLFIDHIPSHPAASLAGPEGVAKGTAEAMSVKTASVSKR